DFYPLVTGVDDFGRNVPRHPNLKQPDWMGSRIGRAGARLCKGWLRRRVLDSIDLVHPTYYDLTEGYELSDFKCPMVTTVHDLIHARFPSQADNAARIAREQRESVLRAERVVCVSESTKRDLLEFIPEAAGKTEVIYHGVSFSANGANDGTDLFESPTFLYVGGRWGYKNFYLLLRAFAKAVSVAPRIKLIVAGYPFTGDDRWEIHFLGLTDKVKSVVFPEEAALQELYRKSVALLYPSRYEGFGIPALEAMACGTIPVTANTTSLPEVVGDAGIMLDPTDEDAWAECMVKLSQSFPGRTQMLERGRKRVKQFTWAECARRHLEIYRRLT
ncbi:MAG TPA: glycosyltransferase family 1 protein, partial [Verrucomicrobiae bacterium]|nr:glycosyltransferase family 1 protein [Verrucomicrobiae bacterium]